MTPILSTIAILIVLGILLWLVNTYIPMDDKFKKLVNIVAIIAAVIWILERFGIFNLLK